MEASISGLSYQEWNGYVVISRVPEQGGGVELRAKNDVEGSERQLEGDGDPRRSQNHAPADLDTEGESQVHVWLLRPIGACI